MAQEQTGRSQFTGTSAHYSSNQCSVFQYLVILKYRFILQILILKLFTKNILTSISIFRTSNTYLDTFYSTEFPQYQPQSKYMSVPYGQAFTTLQYGITYCTIMASIPCIRIPFFSNPDIELEGWGKFGDENQYNNAKWIKENRFVLADRGNESMKCEELFGKTKKVICN